MLTPRTAKYFSLTALLWLAVMTPASATLISAINALNPGDQYRVLFVTSGTTQATSSDIGTYNTFVQAAAAAGSVTSSLGLTWQALASTSAVSAQDNANVFPADSSPVSFFNSDGGLLALSAADLLDDSLLSPPQFTEDGAALFTSVWTGSDIDASLFAGSELGSAVPVVGLADASILWLAVSRTPSLDSLPLYGLSSVATVPSAVPEPATITLTAVGILLVSAAARRRNTVKRC